MPWDVHSFLSQRLVGLELFEAGEEGICFSDD